jgi:serine/threonine protein kinase
VSGESSGGLPLAIIAGAAGGGFVVVAVLVIIAARRRRRRRQKLDVDATDGENTLELSAMQSTGLGRKDAGSGVVAGGASRRRQDRGVGKGQQRLVNESTEDVLEQQHMATAGTNGGGVGGDEADGLKLGRGMDNGLILLPTDSGPAPAVPARSRPVTRRETMPIARDDDASTAADEDDMVEQRDLKVSKTEFQAMYGVSAGPSKGGYLRFADGVQDDQGVYSTLAPAGNEPGDDYGELAFEPGGANPKSTGSGGHGHLDSVDAAGRRVSGVVGGATENPFRPASMQLPSPALRQALAVSEQSEQQRALIDSQLGFPRSLLQFGPELGRGESTCMRMTRLRDEWEGGRSGAGPLAAGTMVAVKEMRMGASNARDHEKFLERIGMMGRLQHANIVRVFGACVEDLPWLLVMEYLPQGDLRSFVRRMPPRVENAVGLLQLGIDIARAMNFLCSRGIIHGNLAARECLVDAEGVVKLGDFGAHTDDQETYENYEGVQQPASQLPVRWMAPEAIEMGRFTSMGDVWSFGVLLWELFTYGRARPYKTVRAMELLAVLLKGKRLRCPEECPRPVHEMMLSCWHYTESKRPGFARILMLLQRLQADLQGEGQPAIRYTLPLMIRLASGEQVAAAVPPVAERPGSDGARRPVSVQNDHRLRASDSSELEPPPLPQRARSSMGGVSRPAALGGLPVGRSTVDHGDGPSSTQKARHARGQSEYASLGGYPGSRLDDQSSGHVDGATDSVDDV